jgi:ribulose-phosphate 3-epimerase
VPVVLRTEGTGRAAPQLSFGVLTADLTRLREEVSILYGSGCWAHVDVMDGAFCPQLTAGAPLVAAVASTGLPVDAHLMVEEPIRFLPEIVAAGPAVVTVHAESTRHLHGTLQELAVLSAAQDRKILRGVGISPGTPVQAVEPVLELADLVLVLAVEPGWPGQLPAASTRRRVEAVRDLADGLGCTPLVGVDGGVSLVNAAQIAGWGVDIVVSGRAIYDGKDPTGKLRRMLEQLRSAPADGGVAAAAS